MLKIESREYKLMLDPGRFSRADDGLTELRRELKDLTGEIGVSLKRQFRTTDRREIVFLDTSSRSLKEADFILRERRAGKAVEYTLKCRTPDRYVSAGAPVTARKGLREDPKFEDDVAPPFVSRFSRSNCVEVPPKFGRPQSVGEAVRLFPGLKSVRDGEGWKDTPLEIVRGFTAFEQVRKGPVFRFGDAEATVAVILWGERPDTEPVIAEFSFRCRAADERFSPDRSRTAKTLFETLQASKSNLFAPESMTKTEFAYRGPSTG